MRIIGLILIFLSTNAIGKTDYVLNCEIQNLDKPKEMIFLLDTKESIFQLLHSDYTEGGVLETSETFYKLWLGGSNVKKYSQVFKATINRITGEFTLNYESQYPQPKKAESLIGICSKNEFKQAL
jgi:hypothetical protein